MYNRMQMTEQQVGGVIIDKLIYLPYLHPTHIGGACAGHSGGGGHLKGAGLMSDINPICTTAASYCREGGWVSKGGGSLLTHSSYLCQL